MLYKHLGINDNGHLTIGGLDACDLAAEYGTPLYVLDEDVIREKCRMYIEGLRQNFGDNSKPLYASKALSFKGIYAVLYNSYNRNAIAYVTRFNADGSQFSIPENCLDNNKLGLYASYYRSIFDWWNVNIGGEVFNTQAKSKIA